MITHIDGYRRAYNKAIGKAMEARENLCAIEDAFKRLEYVPSYKAIDEMNTIADAVITSHAMARHNIDEPGAVFNISVGPITDSKNIAIGNDIEQEINENE